MIFDVKADGRHKARLVAAGNTVDASDYNTYSSVVKTMSVRVLDVIAHRDQLKGICGDVKNAFVTAAARELVYVPVAGLEFGPRAGLTIIIKKVLYGLRTSAAAFRQLLADFIRSMGFIPS